MPPAFLPQLAAGLGVPAGALPEGNLVAVRLRHGAADYKAFAAAASSVGGDEIFVGDPNNVVGTTTAASSAQRGIRVVAVGLLLFGVLALVVTLLLAGQAFARQVMAQQGDFGTLRSLGASTTDLAGVVLLRAATVGVIGGVLAFMLAVLGSPLMSFGLPGRRRFTRASS